MPGSPRSRIRFASVAAGLVGWSNPLVSISLRQLDASHGRQDHTVLPYATTPPVLRGIDRSQSFFFHAALPPLHARNAVSVHRNPHSTYRDDAYAPLHEAGCANRRPRRSEKGEAAYFRSRRLDGPNHVELAGEIRIDAQGLRLDFGRPTGANRSLICRQAVGCRRAGIDGFHGEATTIQPTLGSEVVPYAGVMAAMF